MPSQFATVEQTITAGSDWDGTEPTTTPVVADGVKTYPTHTAGGLFEFAFSDNCTLWEVQRIWVDFNGVATKSILIRREGTPDVDIPIFESTLASEEKYLNTDKIIIARGEKLIITSSGAATAMVARVTAQPKLTLAEF